MKRISSNLLITNFFFTVLSQDMGRMLRIWRGEWRKNDSQYWHFVPVQTDLGLSLYMDEGESFATVEGIVRTHYGVSETTPMVNHIWIT